MVIIGGEANSDLRDLWLFNLDECCWYTPDVEGFLSYTSKRFHTATQITETAFLTFGGCHSEYVHLNEMHLFELD